MTTIAPFAPVVNSDLDFAPIVEADEYQPSIGPDFIPTPEEAQEAVELLNSSDPEPSDPEWDRRADDAHAMAVVSCGNHWL